jgi:hypothetical protein
MNRALSLAAAALLGAPVWAHHGAGTFDRNKDVELTGTITGIDVVDPHSWIYELGKREAAEFQTYAVDDNPRMRCETTSILFDWTFDGAVNRISRNADTIVIQYGQYGFTRPIAV